MDYKKTLWPQQSPINPKFPPAVFNIPQEEIEDLRKLVITRLLHQARIGWVNELLYAVWHVGVEDVDDKFFVRIINETCFSRFLNPQLDPQDKLNFREFLHNNPINGTLYKLDFSVIEKMEKISSDQYFAPTVTLFEKDKYGKMRPLAIRINNLIITPCDGEAWELSKYFVLQGTNVLLVMCMHPLIHFPLDSIVAITKLLLPQEHCLYKLLAPHFFLHLPLNYGVLYNRRTLTKNNQREIYTPFPNTSTSFFEVATTGYTGIEGNSSYPTYSYSLKSPVIYSTYGEFLSAYHDVIRAHVGRMLADVVKGDVFIKRWANAYLLY